MLKPRTSLALNSFIVSSLMFLSIMSPCSHALPTEEREPVEIQSDTVDFQENTGIATYKGHVYARQGDRHLRADVLIVHRVGTGAEAEKIDRITAKGNPARFEASPSSDKSPIYGEARILKYFLGENKIILLKNAQLMQDDRIIQGPSLTYYFNTRLLSSEPLDGQQTKVILKTKAQSE